MATIQQNQSKQCASFYKVLVLLIAFVILMQIDGMAQCNSPTGVPNFSCGTGSTTISANSPNAGTFRWYDSPTDGTLLRTSAANVTADNYSTAVINVTTTFYVSFSDGNCESPRTPVDASVLPSLSDPPLVANPALCGPGSVTLTANSPKDGSNPIPGRFRWYSAPGGTIIFQSSLNQVSSNYTSSILSTTTFYVTFTGRCTESQPIPIVATVNNIPPALLSGNVIPGSACGGSVFPLFANATEARRFNWYTMATGGSLLQTSSSPSNEDSFMPSPLPTVTTTYHVSIADADTGCENTTRTPVTFTVSASVPSTFNVANGSRCGPGGVTVNASTSSGTGVFRWYPSPSSGIPRQTSTTVSNNNFSPNISETTVYYVSYTRGGCVSDRLSASATINPFSSSPEVVPASRCGPGSVTLTVTSAIGGTFRWYSALTGGSPMQTSPSGVTTNDYTPSTSISATTTYYVTFSSGTCESSPRTPVIATVNNPPSQPSVVPGSSCGGSTAALRAITDVAGKFKWYSALTGGVLLQTSPDGILTDSFTPSTLPASTTVYYVTTTNAINGCESSRIPATFSINTEAPATPIAPGGGGANCGTGSVPLSANSGSAGPGTFRWYDNPNESGTLLQTSGPSVATSSYSTPLLSVTTDFYVTFTKPNGCVSSPPTLVKATISLPPPAPTPVPGARCGPGTVTLSATSSESGTFRWYSTLTGGSPITPHDGGNNYTTPSLSATTTFFVTSSNAACESSPRIPVIATINTLPNQPSVISGSNCAGSIAALSASSTIPSTFKWYSVLTGGTLLQTSPGGMLTDNFTPSPLPASTTDYYVTRTDLNGCESSPRTLVSFSVNLASPITPTVIAPLPRCGPGAVTLTANSGSAQGTFRWFTSPDGGIPFSVSGSNFVTHSISPSPSATTTYYVSFTRFSTNCVSSRVPVVATINPLSVVSSVVPGQRCGAGSVTLSATSSAPGIFRWFTVSTGGVFVQQSSSPQTSTTFVTPSLNSSVLYYVTFDNGICGQSTPRTAVTASIILGDAPTIQALQPRCGPGTVTLSASSSSSGTFTWFTTLTGGTPQQTNSNRTFDTFVTPVLSNSTTYYVTLTTNGCESARIPVVASIALKANFDWVGICNGSFTNFIDKTDAAQGSVLSYTWQFGDSVINTPNGVSINADVPLTTHGGFTRGTYKNPRHQFLDTRNYTVTLTASAGASCQDKVTKSIRILSVKKVSESAEWSPMKKDFEWFSEALADTANDWRLASTISGKQIKTNELSWWTGGNKRKTLENSYQNNQSAAINIDQCLDIYSLKRPMISLNYWSDFELNSDGAVAQYSIDNGRTWEIAKIDTLDDAGINWFNGKTILANPGQQKIQIPFLSLGWTGRTNGWRRAAYNLDMIPKEKRDTVRFRIAMATGSTNANDNEGNGVYEGFAFNTMYIGEKKRQVLVEHFTNSKDVASQKADAYLDTLLKRQESLRGFGNADFNSIRYYVRNGNTDGDPLHLDNPIDPNQRAAVYGVTKPPSTFMGGRSFGNITEDIANKFNYKAIDRRALVTPKFTLTLKASSIEATKLKIVFTIKADTIVNVPVVAQVALIENGVKDAAKYGARTYQNVLRRLLLGSDSTKRDGRNFDGNTFGSIGAKETIEKIVEIDTYIANKDSLWLIGFVQDNLTGETYQSVLIKAPAVEGNINPITAVDDALEPSSLNMYPNPVANGKLYLSVPKEFLTAGNWKIADQRGVFVEKGDFESTVGGTKAIDVSQLANGIYFVWISAEGRTPIYRKLVIINRQ